MVNGVSTLSVANRASAARLAVRDDPPDDEPPVRLRGDSFVAGEENRLLAAVIGAWCAATGQRDEQAWGKLTSPLVLVGSTGSGKSHLAAGLAELAGAGIAHFATANDLRRDFAEAIDAGEAPAWRDRLTAHRLVVMDDIDHLPLGANFQQELLHLLDGLTAAGNKLLVTSAQPIAHLRGWLPELASRFASGLTVEIAPLGAACRGELLRQLADTSRWRFSPAAFDQLVEIAPAEPRDLLRLGVDLRRQFGCGAHFETDTLEHFLRLRKKAHAPDLRDIVRVVARYHRLPLKILTSSSRQASVVAARAAAIYLARTLTSTSYEQIGRLLGGRDHTTIMHSYRTTKARLPRDRALREALDDLSRFLGR